GPAPAPRVAAAHLREAGRRGPRLASAPARTGDAGPLAADRLAHAVLPTHRFRVRSGRHRARAAARTVARLDGGRRIDATSPGDPRASRLSPAPLAPRRRPTADARRRGCSCGLRAARDLLLALPADAGLASHALEAGRLERRHAGRR